MKSRNTQPIGSSSVPLLRPVVLIKGLIHYSDEHSVWKRIYNLAVRAGPDVERSTGGIHYPAPALSRRRRSIAQ